MMAQYTKGPKGLILLIENLMRDNSEMLIERRDGSSRLPWPIGGEFKTRSYKKRLGDDICTIQFVYESRGEDTGSIFVTGANGVDKLNSLFKCIPDVKGGISELHIGEKMMTKAEVVKLDDGKGLAVDLSCLFCKELVRHQCKEEKKNE
jgi:hypothetical protein